ncbi:MAG: FAD-dependent thymidylate synthase, partial [Thermoleophilia bacterium]|nr:FAD-dependent thymidylate synthase [Thermoleophilia bacterium]
MIRESFTNDERERLLPFFTNVEDSVFGLVNMPETVKGAMFARYSRYHGTLRRMFLDEFAGDLDTVAARAYDGAEGARAAKLYERIFLGYGDDSVAQLGGAHIACEWVSNVLTKQLQRGRLAAYLEQSTRYIAYDRPMLGGGFRYYRDPELGPRYPRAMDELFKTYEAVMPRVMASVAAHYPVADGADEQAHRRAVTAKALDLLRGLLPAASLSHMGIYASGQAYENMLLRLAASPLPEARRCGERMLCELQKVIPSFVQRVERPDRGGRSIEYLASLRANGERWSAKLGIGEPVDETDAGPSVRLLHHEGDERRLAAALLYESGAVSERQIAAAVDALDGAQLSALLA